MKTRILPVLAVLFAVIVISRTAALSSEVTTTNKEAVALSEAKAGEDNSATPATEAQQCVTGDVLTAINAKMEVLKLREAEMAEKEAAFAEITKRLKKELTIIEAAKNSLAKDTQTRSELAQGDVTHLTTMYATMKPKQAAQIFNKMNSRFAAGFLREMKSQRAGLILAVMDSQKAYEISLVLASRNANYRPKNVVN